MTLAVIHRVADPQSSNRVLSCKKHGWLGWSSEETAQSVVDKHNRIYHPRQYKKNH